MTEKHHNPPLMVVEHLTLMFIFDVDGDGLLSYFDRGVHVLWFQSLPYLSGLLCCFTNDVSISLTRQFILVFE